MSIFSSKPRVVCFGRDLELLRTRVQVLSRRYDAVEVASVDQLAALPAEPAFDLVLLCHSLSREECRASAEIAEQCWPQAKVMVLTAGGSEALYERADAVVASIQGPVVLLQAIDRLIRQGPLHPATHAG